MIKLARILPAPVRPPHLDTSAQWLAGEGAGSWIIIGKSTENYHYEISRFSPEGDLECRSIFSSEKKLDLANEYLITYPSHCSKVTVIQNEEMISFKIAE